jgi:hypothetical protein
MTDVTPSKLRTRIVTEPSAEDVSSPSVLERCVNGHNKRVDLATDDLPFGPAGVTCRQCGGRIVVLEDSRGYMLMVPDDLVVREFKEWHDKGQRDKHTPGRGGDA